MERNNPLNVCSSSIGSIEDAFTGEISFSSVTQCVRAWLFEVVEILNKRPLSLREFLATQCDKKDIDLYYNYICEHCQIDNFTILRPSKPLFLYSLCMCLCMLNHKYVLDARTFDTAYSMAMVDGCFKNISL